MGKVIVTSGDPAGVGPDVIRSWWNNNPQDRENSLIAGPKQFISGLSGIREDQILSVDDNYDRNPGQPSEQSAQIAWDAMRLAANVCAEIKGAVVTGPVCKDTLAQIGYPFPGQTEFFAYSWGGEPTMAFIGPKLKVFLTTWHLPLSEVPAALNSKLLTKTITDAFNFFAAQGNESPCIAVCGLNPHAGENGLLGSEEKEWINPLLAELVKKHPSLSPQALPADTLFYRHHKGDFDGLISLYHDQALCPVKLLEFDSSANTTLGLKFIRTSPDHGTAFHLAGTSSVSSKSFETAYQLASRALYALK